MRDYQRQRLYTAEWDCQVLREQPSFDDVSDAQAFVRELLEDDRVVVRRKKGGHSGAFARPLERTIAMPADGPLKTWLLVHEAAHLATPSVFPGHGREYVDRYLALVEDAFGRTVASRFRASLDNAGVKYGPRDEMEFARSTRRAVRWHDRHDTGALAIITLKDGTRRYRMPARMLGENAIQTSVATGAASPETIAFEDIAYISFRRTT